MWILPTQNDDSLTALFSIIAMLHIVTWNPKKFEKIMSVIHDLIDATQIDLDIPEIQSLIVDEVSKDKAIKAFELIKEPLIVEDTGIYFDAFQDYPGPLAKQTFQWLWISWIKALFDSVTNKTVRFRSVISYIDESLDDPISFIGQSVWEADFSNPNAGFDKNLPYLSFFRPEWKEQVASELDELFRKETHHRVKAARKFGEWLKSRESEK